MGFSEFTFLDLEDGLAVVQSSMRNRTTFIVVTVTESLGGYLLRFSMSQMGFTLLDSVAVNVTPDGDLGFVDALSPIFEFCNGVFHFKPVRKVVVVVFDNMLERTTARRMAVLGDFFSFELVLEGTSHPTIMIINAQEGVMIGYDFRVREARQMIDILSESVGKTESAYGSLLLHTQRNEGFNAHQITGCVKSSGLRLEETLLKGKCCLLMRLVCQTDVSNKKKMIHIGSAAGVGIDNGFVVIVIVDRHYSFQVVFEAIAHMNYCFLKQLSGLAYRVLLITAFFCDWYYLPSEYFDKGVLHMLMVSHEFSLEENSIETSHGHDYLDWCSQPKFDYLLKRLSGNCESALGLIKSYSRRKLIMEFVLLYGGNFCVELTEMGGYNCKLGIGLFDRRLDWMALHGYKVKVLTGLPKMLRTKVTISHGHWEISKREMCNGPSSSDDHLRILVIHSQELASSLAEVNHCKVNGTNVSAGTIGLKECNNVGNYSGCLSGNNTQLIVGILDRISKLETLDFRGNNTLLVFWSGISGCWLLFVFQTNSTSLDLKKAVKDCVLIFVLRSVYFELLLAQGFVLEHTCCQHKGGSLKDLLLVFQPVTEVKLLLS